MMKLAWRGVRHNPGRYLATMVAIMLGVAFYSATGFVSDRVIDTLEGDSVRLYGNVDLLVTSAPEVDDEDGDIFGPGQINIAGDVAEQLSAIEGVDATAGVLAAAVGLVDGDEPVVELVGRLWVDDDVLNPLTVDEGRAPSATGEVAVDVGTMEARNLQVGDSINVVSLAGTNEVTIVGTTRFGSSDAIDGSGTVSISRAQAFDWLADGSEQYQELYLRSDSLGQTELKAAADRLVPTGFSTQEGDAFLADKQNELGAIGKLLKRALQAFAFLALFVGAFVIYNTFTVIVAQRVRELAVLRAIGATPRQVKRALRAEGVVIGLLGSGLGVLVGLGLTYLFDFVLGRFGVELPGSGVKITFNTIWTAMVLGTLVTIVSVIMPARRAARTEPIEALRDAAVESTPFSTIRLVLTALLASVGLVALLAGGKGWQFGLGLLALFVSAIVAGPILAVAMSKLMKPAMSKLGLEGRLAVDNSSRNPQRTATTANALLIGVFLVTLVSVAGSNVKDYAVGQLQDLEAADYALFSNGGVIDDELMAKISAIDGVDGAVSFVQIPALVDGTPGSISAGDLAELRSISNLQVLEGSLDDLGPGTIAVSDAGRVGDTVTVESADGRQAELRVVAVLEGNLDTFQLGSLVHPETTAELSDRGTVATAAFVDVARGAPAETADLLERSVELRPDIELRPGNQLGQLVGRVLDFIINAVNGLLMMSVLVAVIGIINTLSLSIFERRRELGLLRAIGMVDKRVQRMVRLESVLIAALGTVAGAVLGLFSGWAVIRAMNRIDEVSIDFALPVGRLVLVIVVGVVLGFLAALIPARRSTRLDVLDAIATA